MRDQFNQYGDNPTGYVVFEASPRPAEKPPVRTVLMLMSNPMDTPKLRLDEEHRAIDRAIVAARHRDQLDLRTGTAPRDRDLHDLLLRHRPAVVHYAGHHGVRGIALVDDAGRARAVAPAALEDLFSIVKGSVRCVVLNACLTADQASAIAAHIPCVVGMSRAVLDVVAIEFAAGFYRALADGESVATAFRYGRSRLALSDKDTRDPVLVSPPGIAEDIFITG